jgi:hypothetical protein
MLPAVTRVLVDRSKVPPPKLIPAEVPVSPLLPWRRMLPVPVVVRVAPFRLIPEKLPVVPPAVLALSVISPLVLVMLLPEFRVILRLAFRVRLLTPLLRVTPAARAIVVPKIVVGIPRVALLVRFTVPVVAFPAVKLVKPAGMVVKLGVNAAPAVKGAIVKLPTPWGTIEPKLITSAMRLIS